MGDAKEEWRFRAEAGVRFHSTGLMGVSPKDVGEMQKEKLRREKKRSRGWEGSGFRQGGLAATPGAVRVRREVRESRRRVEATRPEQVSVR